MEVVTLESRAFQELISKIDELRVQFSKRLESASTVEKWLSVKEACLALKVSTRTLQAYRDNDILPYSKIGSKVYFKSSDINKLLEKHYTGSL